MENDFAMLDRPKTKDLAHSFGSRLKLARENLHLSQKDVATRLFLNPKIIDTIETENCDSSPHATFMRGYARSYAKLLNFTDQDINAALNQTKLAVPALQSTNLITSKRVAYQSERYIHWVSYSVIIISLVMVAVWWNTRSLTRLPHHLPVMSVSTKAIVLPQRPASPLATNYVLARPATPAVSTPQLSQNTLANKPVSANNSQALAKKVSPDIASMAMALPEPGLEAPR
jgi:cytoskeletal protein RodZ